MISGAKSEEDAKTVGKMVGKLCQKTGHEVKFKGFKVENMVGGADVQFPIRLEQLYSDHQAKRSGRGRCGKSCRHLGALQ